MIICGVKLTHDAAIALIDNGHLIFSYEVEKIKNNPRHSTFNLTLNEINDLLNGHGYDLKNIDRIVFDGWYNEDHDFFNYNGFKIKLSDYGINISNDDIFLEKKFHLPEFKILCKSYKHVVGHASAAYCTSPFAKFNQDSFILVWDGGMVPQLFYYDYSINKFINIKNLFSLIGVTFQFFVKNFEPFMQNKDLETIPGKAMAFAGIGEVNDELLKEYKEIFNNADLPLKRYTREEMFEMNMMWCRKFASRKIIKKYESPDLVATFQKFIEFLLVLNLRTACDEFPNYQKNLCISGGTGLNIIWNSAIRQSGLFDSVWIPPFTNDSGSAIGTACCEMMKYTHYRDLEWDVYSGPQLDNAEIDDAWEKYPCSLRKLAWMLYTQNEPVIFLNKKAELGPRALGNRSILAPAKDIAMKHFLNHIKEREFYRPIAPICLEADAPNIFEPGTPDPYMLFAHKVKNEWRDKIQAVCHLDGTARLQTVNKNQNKEIYELLLEYKKLSKIPLLCNTSANFKGKGFFPDIKSAMKWGKINLIWNDGHVFIKKGHSKFLYKLDDTKQILEVESEIAS